jgi:hypothetical protein
MIEFHIQIGNGELGSTVIHAASEDEAIEMAKAWALEGDYGDPFAYPEQAQTYDHWLVLFITRRKYWGTSISVSETLGPVWINLCTEWAPYARAKQQGGEE